jgi:hypothetical protein
VDLALKEWPKYSARMIAEMCGVGAPMVAAYRPETSCKNITTEKRTGVDGKQYKATHTKPDPAPDPLDDDAEDDLEPVTVTSSTRVGLSATGQVQEF